MAPNLPIRKKGGKSDVTKGAENVIRPSIKAWIAENICLPMLSFKNSLGVAGGKRNEATLAFRYCIIRR